jgi:non-specific protein-tyrosine kinase
MDAVARQLPANHSQVLLFTAAAPGTDATTVLLNLAITRAKHGQGGVVLVDADLRRSAVAERLGLPPAPGLADVLAGTVPLHRALRETGQANLHALMAGKALETSHRLLAGESMRAIFRYLRGRFEWVLVDAPRWDGRPEVVALGAACDAVYLVLPEAQADTPQVEELVHLVADQGSCLRGCVLIKD